MGLTRIFGYAVLGTLLPAIFVIYLAFAPANTASAEACACRAAQGFVSQSLGADQPLRFLDCAENKEMRLKDGAWQVLGDVEIDTGAGTLAHESYVVRLKLGEDGTGTLESLSLR